MANAKNFLVEADTDFYGMFIWSTKPGPGGTFERAEIVFTSCDKDLLANRLKELLVSRSEVEDQAEGQAEAQQV